MKKAEGRTEWYQSEKGKAYNAWYKREMMFNISLKLHRVSDADLIEVYKSIPDKTGFLREALRNYKEKA